MLSHEKLKVYQAALAFTSEVYNDADGWNNTHAVKQQLIRASNSILVNIAQATNESSKNKKIQLLEYAIGSSLECAACTDVAECKSLLDPKTTNSNKETLLAIVKILYGLRKSWQQMVLKESHTEYPAQGMFRHEDLDVYKLSLKLVAALSELLNDHPLSTAIHKDLDKSSTSIPLNIAEGNGRYSMLDHCRFIHIAENSAIKLSANLDICKSANLWPNPSINEIKRMLTRIVSMTKQLSSSLNP